jgi:hypothetical protein
MHLFIFRATWRLAHTAIYFVEGFANGYYFFAATEGSSIAMRSKSFAHC